MIMDKKTLVVFYSLEGNTAYAAERIAEALSADILRIEPEKAYPSSGFKKFLWGGKSAVMAETPVLKPYECSLAAYERVILGFPVWAGNITPPLRTFLKENDLQGKQVASFACQSGSGAEKAFRKLKDCLKIEQLEAELVLIDPKKKPSEENEKKIEAFCNALKRSPQL